MSDPALKTPAGRWPSLALGTTAGLLNGLIALGGGILVTPFLVRYRRLPPHVAVGTSLVVVVVLSAIGFVAHTLHGNLSVDTRQIVGCTLGGVIGTVIGSKILAALTPRWMMKAFAVFLILVSVRLIAEGLGFAQSYAGLATIAPWTALLVIGCVTGVLSAIFGVGGGALALLALATIYGVPLKEGLPVALALNVSNALSGVVYHARNKSIRVDEVGSLVPAALLGVVIGVWLAQLASAEVLRIVFGSALLLLAARLLRNP